MEQVHVRPVTRLFNDYSINLTEGKLEPVDSGVSDANLEGAPHDHSSTDGMDLPSSLGEEAPVRARKQPPTPTKTTKQPKQATHPEGNVLTA